MTNPSKTETFQIPSLGIVYEVVQSDSKRVVQMDEQDFEKLFNKLRELEDKVEDLQLQVIEDLKRQALIKNILNS